jgi:hypothetical protein
MFSRAFSALALSSLKAPAAWFCRFSQREAAVLRPLWPFCYPLARSPYDYYTTITTRKQSLIAPNSRAKSPEQAKIAHLQAFISLAPAWAAQIKLCEFRPGFVRLIQYKNKWTFSHDSWLISG